MAPYCLEAMYRLRARGREGKVRFVYGTSARLGLFTCDVTRQSDMLTTAVEGSGQVEFCATQNSVYVWSIVWVDA